MPSLDMLLEEIVTANRILAHEGVVDSFGHVSSRHPDNPKRFIHGGIYEARPDVHGVVHNHSPSVIPFGITERKLRPLLHMCANIGHEVPTWDSHDKFGDTALLVESVDMG